MRRDDVVLQWGQSIEKALMRLFKQYGYRTFSQDKENYSPVDGVLQGKDLTPIQIKAITPRFVYRDIGFTKTQWLKYKKFGLDYSKFTCYVLCTAYCPTKDLDYRLYEFDINSLEPWNEDNNFYYIKLDKMKISNIEIPEEFQRRIERTHREYIRPLIDADFRNNYKDKY